MWTWITCYLSGRHEYGISCEPGAVFLRCVQCGRRRSQGWALRDGERAQQSTQKHTVIPAIAVFDTASTAQRQ